MRNGLLLSIFCVLLLILFASGMVLHAMDKNVPLEEENGEVNEDTSQTPQDEEEGEGDSKSMVPIDPENPGLPSQIGEDMFGIPLDESAAAKNTGGSPWGGILFFAAAIALGVGLSIARNKK